MNAAKKRAPKLEARADRVEFKELLRIEPNGGITNISYVRSARALYGSSLPSRVQIVRGAHTIDGKKVPIWFAADVSRHQAPIRETFSPGTMLRLVCSSRFLTHMILNSRRQR
jgi:hypothetical protein